uniref:Uncharacterized protein n=1 Tax=Anguilla anguilla TaxID=7936 RepID=A0A0E9UZS6_ANGAN
MVQKYFQNFVC